MAAETAPTQRVASVQDVADDSVVPIEVLNHRLTAARHTKTFGRHLLKNPWLLVSAFILSMVFFAFGFDGGLVSGLLEMEPFIQRFGTMHTPVGTMLSATDVGLVVGFPSTGCLLGMPLSAGLGDRYGRKVSLLVGCFLTLVGSAIQTAAPNLAAMVAGRWIANAAIFLYIVMGSTFLAELAPPVMRGAIMGLSIVLINSAAIFSSGLNWAMSTNETNLAWQLPTGIQLVWPGLIALGIVFFMEDSPTYFLTRGQDGKALHSLRRVRGGFDEDEILAEFEVLKKQADLRREEVAVPWTHLFKGSDLRRTVLALSIANMQPLSGISLATNYATTFLASIDHQVSPFLLVTCLGFLALSGAIVGLLVVDIVGRRTLALTTFVALFIIDLVIAVLGFTDYAVNDNLSRTIAGFCGMFAFFFAAGFGPLTYIISGEMATARLRNMTSAFSFFVLACFTTGVTYVLPYIVDANAADLGPKTYLIFAGWMAGCIVLVFLYLPETKGRTPAELDIMFREGVPARQFRDYACNVSLVNMMHENKNVVDC